MNKIYLGILLSLICLFLAYFILSKFLIVTVFCVILAGLYFKDDFTLLRYLATHVASFYSWICDIFSSIQNMYHQSNNTNIPVRRCIENNGTVTSNYERLNHGTSYNLSTSYAIDNQPLSSGVWDSSSNFSPTRKSLSIRTQPTLQELSKLHISSGLRGEHSVSQKNSANKTYYSLSMSPLKPSYPTHSRSRDSPRSTMSTPSSIVKSNVENKRPLDAKLYADVSSPGFCSRVAERLTEAMTHQSKYDSVGAFPVVNLKSQSPKIKIKTPVRVRLAPPSNELVQYSYGGNPAARSPVLGPDDSMKSVLQVLKEISRKRIHSHIDEESEETSKRLRVTDSQFDSNGMLHTSLLQQTIQGKRAREESSPNEDDKKRRKPLQNNEIMSSLSSSVSIHPPHLKTKKRKAQSIDDSINATPVLGKLLKVQTEITPSPPANNLIAPSKPADEELRGKKSPSPGVPLPAAVDPTPVKVKAVEPPVSKTPESDEDGAVSRLLGRMSDQTSQSAPVEIPVKKNVFMSTNDLSLSPPKENRLAAMIAVLGGPSDQSELENIQAETSIEPERAIKGKALFTTPETPATPETPKQGKKVTFSDSLTTTKVFERDQPDNENSSAVGGSKLAPQSTPLSSLASAVGGSNLAPQSSPLSSVTFSASSSPTSIAPKLNFIPENTSGVKPFAVNFGSSPLSSSKEFAKAKENENNVLNIPTSSVASTVLSPFGSQTSMFQLQTNNSTTAPSQSTSSGLTFSIPAQVTVSNSSVNLTSPSFSFGTNSSSVESKKETAPKQNSANKPFAFGSEPKTSQSLSSGFPSVFSTPTAQNGTTQAIETGNVVQKNPAEQNKPTFNIYSPKDITVSTNKSEVDNKQLVNGFTPLTSSLSPFAISQPVSQANSNKPAFPNFGANNNANSAPQTAPAFNFGSSNPFSTGAAVPSQATQSTTSTVSSSTPQVLSSTNSLLPQLNSTLSATSTQSLNIFSTSTSASAQNKPGPFGGGVTQGTSVFGDSTFKVPSSSGPTSETPSIFGINTTTKSSGFGTNAALQNGTATSTSGTTQNKNLFGNVSSNSTPKPISFGSGVNASTPQATVFGFSSTPASTQANSNPFGISLNNPASQGAQQSTMFGNPTTTAQTTSMFGNVTSSTGPQSSTFPQPSTTAGQSSVFGSSNSNDAAKNMFASSTNSTPTFGGLSSTTTPAFGTQNNPPSFGSQPTTTVSAFGNQSAPAFSFGSQNTNLNPTQSGFGSSGSFSASSSSSNTNEVKPPAFSSATPYMFSSSSTNKPTELVKPLGTATSFNFGSNAQPNVLANPAQPSVPSFGAPSPAFGTSQPAPTFGSTSSQPAAPTFQFGQASASGAPTFQFNAAPQPAAGMFSIGSGGSSVSRNKTTALRRSHKRT